MGKTNTCNIEEDEALAEEVRKYPCIYIVFYVNKEESITWNSFLYHSISSRLLMCEIDPVGDDA